MEDSKQAITNQQGQEFKYYAFISYNSKDTEWGKRVQRKLEHYRMPATLCSERGWKRKPINPVFFAPTDIQPGGLSEELQERLKASRNLIVICSPNSAKSEWVGKEIEFFHNLGRTQQIHFFIVDGVPHSGDPETECFNPIVDKLGLPEILGANINERIYSWSWLNKERAYVQLVSKLLGVEFDAIWQRHRRQLIVKAVAWTVGIIAVIAALLAVWMLNQPFNARLTLNETTPANEQLPPLHDAVITVDLGNESKCDTIHDGSEAVFTNIPHRFMGKQVHVTVTCPDYLPVDTTLVLSRSVSLDVARDADVYGHVHFTLWNPATESPIVNTTVKILNHEAKSDINGKVELFIPLEEQRRNYVVDAGFALQNDTVYMPSGDYDVLLKK